MIAHKRVRDGYIVDDRPALVEYLPPAMFITEVITDKDYYPLPAESGEVVQLQESEQ